MTGVIVHEWLEQFGGAEKVMEEMADVFSDADIVSLWDGAPGRFEEGRVKETWMARTPLRRSKSLALPFMPTTWRHLGHSEAEWILCSSHLFAHHARFSGPAKISPKFVYCYTPARYIWEPDLDARGSAPLVKLASLVLRPIDRARAEEAYSVASISQFVQKRVERAWGRESRVIYPPVDVELYSSRGFLTDQELRTLNDLPDQFILGASRFIPYKRLDLAIRAGQAAGIPVVLAGDGPDRERLIEMGRLSGNMVTFILHPSQPLLRELYARALAYVFMAIEDFGIMPVEAMAAGTPVIGRRVGGVAETVVDGKTGVLLDETSDKAFIDAVDKVAGIKPADCVARARVFAREVFREKINGWVNGNEIGKN